MARLAFLSAVCAVALAAPGVAQAQLVATVSDPGIISLTQDGVPVTHLDPGTYTIEVHDTTPSHNFHLTGPGVSETTGISAEEAPTWTVTFTHGSYHFQCDVHPDSMFGNFTVGNVLEVDKTGTGLGTVTSTPAGIDCGGTCSAAYPGGGMVALTATATPGSTFTGWSGACTGAAACEVTVVGRRVGHGHLHAQQRSGPAAGDRPAREGHEGLGRQEEGRAHGHGRARRRAAPSPSRRRSRARARRSSPPSARSRPESARSR